MKNRTLSIVIFVLTFLNIINYLIIKKKNDYIHTIIEQNNKINDYYYLLNHWLELKNTKKNSAVYFEEMGYRRVAIYGMAEIANRLIEDLEKSNIEIVYGIDRDISCSISKIGEVYSLEDDLPEADVIVVTPCYAFQSIYKELKTKVSFPIISIEDVIWSV